VKADPNKDVVLDVSSTSSDSNLEDFMSPLVKLNQGNILGVILKHCFFSLLCVRPTMYPIILVLFRRNVNTFMNINI